MVLCVAVYVTITGAEAVRKGRFPKIVWAVKNCLGEGQKGASHYWRFNLPGFSAF